MVDKAQRLDDHGCTKRLRVAFGPRERMRYNGSVYGFTRCLQGECVGFHEVCECDKGTGKILRTHLDAQCGIHKRLNAEKDRLIEDD